MCLSHLVSSSSFKHLMGCELIGMVYIGVVFVAYILTKELPHLNNHRHAKAASFWERNYFFIRWTVGVINKS